MEDGKDDWHGKYRKSRTEDNYRRYIRILELLAVLAALFLGRNIIFYDAEFHVFPSYATVYSAMLVVALVFRIMLAVLHNRRHYALLERAVMVLNALILFLMVNLCLLDSFFISNVDFTAYIFGTFMFGFIYRTRWETALILFLFSMVYYIAAYYILNPEQFDIPLLLPLGPITLLAFYFSWTRENMYHRLFRTSYELAESNRKLTEQSRRDALTGLHNRRYMEDFLNHQIALYRRQRTGFSLIFTDIDHFKRVNDEQGHAAGDLVLKEFASILGEESRESDLVVRYGGEEFLIVLPGTMQVEAQQMAERIRQSVETKDFSAIPWTLTASFGISCMKEGCDAASLIRRVDDLLYTAKREGRNRCCGEYCFSPV